MSAWLRRLGLFVLLGMGLVVPAAADEFRPAYLQLRQVDATTYEVMWKLPALDESTTLKLRPQFPHGTLDITPLRSSYAAGTAVQFISELAAQGPQAKRVSLGKHHAA